MMPLNTSWAGAGLLRATSATQLTYTPVTFFSWTAGSSHIFNHTKFS